MAAQFGTAVVLWRERLAPTLAFLDGMFVLCLDSQIFFRLHANHHWPGLLPAEQAKEKKGRSRGGAPHGAVHRPFQQRCEHHGLWGH